MTKEIPLSQGKIALVDDADYDWLNQWKWSYQASGPQHRTEYASRREWTGESQNTIYMHRRILGLSDGQMTDHINHNGLDNRRANLRIATPAQNAQNVKKPRGCKLSRFKGVGPHHHKWYAAIDWPPKHLGMFLTEEEAALAYNEAALLEYGEFASLNPITEEQAAKAREVRVAEIEKVRQDRTRFGRELRGRRLRAGLTQQDFADLAGIHHSLVSLYETGRRLPTVNTARKLARCLDHDWVPEWLELVPRPDHA